MPLSMLELPTAERGQGDGLREDRPRRRFAWAVAASIALNIVLWREAASSLIHPMPPSPVVVEITRVVLPKPAGPRPKPPKPHRVIPPKPKPILRTPPPPPKAHTPPPRLTPPRPHPAPPHVTPRPAPPTAHNHVMTARPDHTAPAPHDHTARGGGNAAPGVPLHSQSVGNARTEPPVQPKPAPESPRPQPPKPEPPASKPDPPTPEPPKPAPAPEGPTQDAEPSNQEKPEIPDELKQDTFKSFVRVRVEIEADGSFTPALRTSSGNAEIDRRVLSALKRWRWKPALKNGFAVHSTQLFKFEFEVE